MREFEFYATLVYENKFTDNVKVTHGPVIKYAKTTPPTNKHHKKNLPNRFSGKEQPIVPSYKFRTEKEKKKKTLSKILSDF